MQAEALIALDHFFRSGRLEKLAHGIQTVANSRAIGFGRALVNAQLIALRERDPSSRLVSHGALHRGDETELAHELHVLPAVTRHQHRCTDRRSKHVLELEAAFPEAGIL